MRGRGAALLPALAAILGGAPAAAQAPPTPAAAAVATSHALAFARVQVNGHEGLFLVDTGAPSSLVDSAFAARARLRLGQVQVLGGGGGFVDGRVADDVSVQAAGGPTLRLDPAVTDLSEIAAMFGHGLDGVLGADYFGRMVLTLDYRTGQARFAEPAAVRPPPGATRLRIISTPFIRAVAQAGDRRVEGSFQIDTGSNTAVSFYGPLARRAFPQVRGTPVPTVGLGGQSRSRMANLDRLDLAGRTLTNVEADYANEMQPDDSPGDFAGVIGGPAFAGRVLHLDYARSVMWLD